jgi:hypothetical protein
MAGGRPVALVRAPAGSGLWEVNGAGGEVWRVAGGEVADLPVAVAWAAVHSAGFTAEAKTVLPDRSPLDGPWTFAELPAGW